MYKTKKHLSLFFLAVVIAFVFFVPPTLAATKGYVYTPLEQIPGTSADKQVTFPGYVQAIYRFALFGVGIAALLMLSIGGFMYMSSAGNQALAGSAKQVITNALFGLLMVLLAWLLLSVINPDLTSVNLKSLEKLRVEEKPTTAVPPSPEEKPITPTPPPLGQGLLSNNEAVALLNSAGISVWSTDSCSDPTKSTCTSLEGIPQSTIDTVINLKKTSNCNITITGGTETGHSSHGSGRPVVDLNDNGNDCLANALKNPEKHNIVKICTMNNRSDIRYNCSNYVEDKSHFHVVFN